MANTFETTGILHVIYALEEFLLHILLFLLVFCTIKILVLFMNKMAELKQSPLTVCSTEENGY